MFNKTCLLFVKEPSLMNKKNVLKYLDLKPLKKEYIYIAKYIIGFDSEELKLSVSLEVSEVLNSLSKII